METRTKLITGVALAVGVLGIGGGIALAADDDDNAITGAQLDQATASALAHTGGGRITGSEIDDDGGPVRYEIEVTLDDGTEVDLDLDSTFTVLHRDTDREDDRDDDRDGDRGPATPVTPEQLDQAEAAALAHIGGGRITGADVDDDGGPVRYEIEVTLDDGSEVDVDLDESFVVLGTETDGPYDD